MGVSDRGMYSMHRACWCLVQASCGHPDQRCSNCRFHRQARCGCLCSDVSFTWSFLRLYPKKKARSGICGVHTVGAGFRRLAVSLNHKPNQFLQRAAGSACRGEACFSPAVAELQSRCAAGHLRARAQPFREPLQRNLRARIINRLSTMEPSTHEVNGT